MNKDNKLEFYTSSGVAVMEVNALYRAPVNCGYDATHTYGLLYQWGRSRTAPQCPSRQRLP